MERDPSAQLFVEDMNDINIDEFEDFDDESDIDSSDCDTSDDVSSENDDTFEYETTDAEDLTTTDDDDESDGEEFGKLLIVPVLEPSINNQQVSRDSRLDEAQRL